MFPVFIFKYWIKNKTQLVEKNNLLENKPIKSIRLNDI